MNTNRKLSFLATLCFAAAIASGQAQVTVYDNLGTTATAGASQSAANSAIYGDSLNLAAGGTLTIFGATIFNSQTGNTGAILTGTTEVKFYDNTVPYTGGTLNAPLLGTASLDWDFTADGGLPAGFYTTATYDLSFLNIVLPQNILVTQQFTQTSGGSVRYGVVLMGNPVTGTSPNTYYIKSSTTAAGLYTGSGGQIGYTVQVAPGGGNNPPVANAQNVSLVKDTTASITLTGSDVDNDPLTFNVATQPANGVLTGSAPNVTYQPNADYVGSDSFTFTANDGFVDSAPATVSITVNPPSAGLIIVPVFDSSITSDPNAATIMNTINAAIQVYESRFADPVTVQITFAEMGSGLGQSSTFGAPISYTSFLNALIADSKTASDVTALATIPGGSTTPVDGLSNIRVTTANARALGINLNPPGGASDSTISLNTSLMNLDRVTINPSKYDLMAVVSHEIDEALGTGSGVSRPNCSPVDLYRYAAGGGRNYTTSGDNAFFSIDGGVTDLARYNQNATGDYGDWWSLGAHTPKVQDAFGTAGATPNLGVELTVLDVIGWDLVTPAPPPNLGAVARVGNNISFAWTAVSGRNYQVQYGTNLTQGAWLNLGGVITATGSTASASDPIGTNTKRYYRVALLPAPAPPSPARAAGPALDIPVTLTTKYFLPAPK